MAKALNMVDLLLKTTEFYVIRCNMDITAAKTAYYDIPVYRRDGNYTMHRIVKVTKSGYVICGDNRTHLERDITDKDIVGVFAGMYRDGNFVEAAELVSFGIKACRNYPIRKCAWIWKRIKRRIGKIK